MRFISHRGNIIGPKPDKENRPSYIDSAIQLGYDVEVDLRFINGEFWLGHDEPQYQINTSWIIKRKENIWYHCKDIYSSFELIKLNSNLQFFCHSSDDYVLTSVGKLWVHNLDNGNSNFCIIPLIDLPQVESYEGNLQFGICSDYIYECRLKFEK